MIYRTKMFRMGVWLLLLSALTGGVAAQQDEAASQLRRELEYIFSDPAFATAHWGVAIQSMKTGEYLYLRNEHKAFMPASNMKLFSTAAALLALGPEYRFVTRLYAGGAVDADGTLQGDLVLAGCADPSLSGRWEQGKITRVFQRWADSLRIRGIKRVAGRVVGDGRYFSDESLGAGWSWDYLSDYYSAQISALTFNDNCVDLLFTPGDSLGAPAGLRLDPPTRYIEVDNRVVTGPSTDLRFRRVLGGNRVVCRGTIALDEKEKRDWITVENPALYAATVFGEVLAAGNIPVAGGAAEATEESDGPAARDDLRLLASHVSPPLAEMVRVTNKDSNNLFAELLLRVVGRETGEGGTAEQGEKAARRLFEPAGITPEQLSMADGSGLSRLDLVTPLSVVKLLRYMRQQPAGEAYYNSLPIAGVDGTLKGRMRFTAARNNVRAKTGFIGRVRALSGYVTTRDQEELVFSMICNNYAAPTGNANYLQDLVCERLADFSRR